MVKVEIGSRRAGGKIVIYKKNALRNFFKVGGVVLEFLKDKASHENSPKLEYI